MVENCAGVTHMPRQQRASKPLFQPGLVVSTINTFQRGHCIELHGITYYLLINISPGNLNIHQTMNSGHCATIPGFNNSKR